MCESNVEVDYGGQFLILCWPTSDFVDCYPAPRICDIRILPPHRTCGIMCLSDRHQQTVSPASNGSKLRREHRRNWKRSCQCGISRVQIRFGQHSQAAGLQQRQAALSVSVPYYTAWTVCMSKRKPVLKGALKELGLPKLWLAAELACVECCGLIGQGSLRDDSRPPSFPG